MTVTQRNRGKERDDCIGLKIGLTLLPVRVLSRKVLLEGKRLYCAMNIIAYYRSTHCVGGLGEYPSGNFLILRCL